MCILLITKFSWILYIFAIILIITGIKTFYISGKKFDIRDFYLYKILQKYCNITHEIKGFKFLVTINNKLHITPLFIALLLVEVMDIIFAIDSIPAIFAITNDPYIIYTSNIFAILGLRTLFFFLKKIIERFNYVKYSLALILILIGIKIFAAHFIVIPSYVPLVMTIMLLFCGIIISLTKKQSITKN